MPGASDPINREYYPEFDQIIKGEKKTTLWQRMPVLPSLFGRMMVKALSPNSNQKLKAPEIAGPQRARLIRKSSTGSSNTRAS